MQRLVFYLIYPIFYLIASLPFHALYRFSDFLFYMLWLSGYRKKVVLQNLQKSFPKKSKAELEQLCRDFYKYLCDLIVETLKTLRMTEKEAVERCVFHNADLLNKLYNEGKSIILVMGHYGNWEWAGPSFSLNTKHPLTVIYRPLSNPYFERMMTSMRTKFGTKITPAHLTLRDMVANRNSITATAFIADQAASTANPYWTIFLNQDTSVFNGPEKLAVKFNYPVIYISIARRERGFYDLTPELLFENPSQTKENEILETFTQRLEKDIIKEPRIWLWSHRRWKHQRHTS